MVGKGATDGRTALHVVRFQPVAQQGPAIELAGRIGGHDRGVDVRGQLIGVPLGVDYVPGNYPYIPLIINYIVFI